MFIGDAHVHVKLCLYMQTTYLTNDCTMNDGSASL
jgi:hypothetical protein